LKKLVLLLFVFAFCRLVFAQNGINGFSSGTKTEIKNGMIYSTIYLKPKNQAKWTGEVWKSTAFGNYGFGGDEIKAGKDLLGTICRGWVLWDISVIPSNAIIESASIRAYCNNTAGGSNHRLEIKKLNVDPRLVTESTLFNSIGLSNVFFTGLWNAMTTSGYHEMPYTQTGLLALQNDLGNEYHGISISESGDNDPIGTFRGWNWNGGANPEPILLVTYSMPAPDLVVSMAVNPASAQQGERIPVSWNVQNKGTSTAGSSKLGYYLHKSGSSPNSYFLGQHNVPALSTSGNYYAQDSITIPSDLPAGTNYYLLFSADYLNEVEESNEINNNLSRSFAISPDTYIITVTANPSEGGTVSGDCAGVTSGTPDTLNAYPNTGWAFVNWTENDLVVSDSPTYIFNVTCSRNFIGNFMYMIPNAPGNLTVQLNTVNFSAELNWTDNSVNEEGFYIERKSSTSDFWQQICSLDSNTCSYSDYNITPDNEYFYRIRSFNAYGTSAYSNVQSVQILGIEDLQYKDLIPDNNFLSNNYPNPFNPTTRFSFGLKSNAAVNLSVYSITGQIVETIIDNSSMSAGVYTCSYSAVNLSSGFYLYVLTVSTPEGNYKETKKMVYLK
jgi:hypothetical protein